MRYFLFSIITLHFFWLPLAQATTNCTTQINIPESECKTLLSLFNSTTGAGWYDIFEGGWNITNTPCSWAGITCREGHVIAIDRQNNGLNGFIPDLTDLNHLEILNLSHNQLNGSIVPANFPPSLQTLSLNNNQLSGTAPDLNHFSHLTTVNLGNNQLTATIDDNDDTIILPSQFVSGVSLCPTDKQSINDTCNASGNTLLCNVTIEEAMTVSQAVFECDAENKGWLSNSTIKAGATVQGGILTGSISNEGILVDFDFRGRSIIGGMLSGIIVNNSKVGGYFQDVSLAPETQISGGRFKGKITGDADAPALIEEAEILEGSQLSYVTIGENTQVAKGVKIGAGVRFTHQDQIPMGTDLTAALVVNFADKLPSIDMNIDVLIKAPTLLEQINGLSEIKDNDWQLVQNPENGQLELTIEGIRFALLPVQVKQTKNHAKLTINPDGSITFITAQGREILAYPVIQDMSALIEAIAPLGIHQVALQENGILTAELNESKVVARTDMAATPVSDDEPLGLFLSESSVSAKIESNPILTITTRFHVPQRADEAYNEFTLVRRQLC